MAPVITASDISRFSLGFLSLFFIVSEWLFVRDRTRTSTGYSSGMALNLPRQGTSEAGIVLGLGSGRLDLALALVHTG